MVLEEIHIDCQIIQNVKLYKIARWFCEQFLHEDMKHKIMIIRDYDCVLLDNIFKSIDSTIINKYLEQNKYCNKYLLFMFF